MDRANWKGFVRGSILEERELRRNWKERICKLSSLEFERGGSLCAVAVHENLICSGYSSGAVVIWEGDGKNILRFRELITTVDTQGQKPQVSSIAVHNTLCAVGFDNGDVCTWHTSLSLSPLCHCRCEGSVKSVLLAASGPPAFAAMTDHELKVQMSDSNGQWTCLESRNYEDKIGHAMFIPSSASGSSTEHVAIATQDTVSVVAPGKGLLSTLDHVIGGKLSCMDCTADRLALGVGSYGYGTLGNKVRLYCLETTKMISILGSHYARSRVLI
ncbi:regulation of transcription factor catabolic process [Desmophyllum pertusum]|uniref:Regulation of transcription factor catabolic process n=1 Tax=Desmophyllum pertusum TaxID=174260 RepID=A0A9W9YCV1_9CNID|nr:regulation of transcription factor catabolic process [Desmophyllum pertusum]